MTNRTKAIIACTVIGTAATVAIVCFIKRRVAVAEVHLFETNAQVDKEKEIDDLIPKHE